ncbi:MAG: tellurium resistance protein TerC [Pseudomonadota bacterium]
MLESLFTFENLTTFVVLTALETVLGFDNLLYISIEAKQVDPARQSWVRRWGIIIAIALRIVLLFGVLQLIALLQEPLFVLNHPWIAGEVSGHALIVLAGGVFLIYTAVKEIYHMIGVDDLDHEVKGPPRKTVRAALTWIVLMNLVFSFDTVLSAVALTDHFVVMTAAILVSGVLMVAMADRVAAFLQKNRMYEVLGLFVLLLVGVMLMSDGGHIGHLKFFGYAIEPMAKSTFYFVLVTLVAVEIVQSRYQKRILAEAQLKRRAVEAIHG